VIERLRQQHAYRARLSNAQIRRCVRAVPGAEDALSVAVVTHVIWQVKRKLHGQKVEHHLMLVLHGKQGSGKTEAIKALLKPLWLLVDMPGDLTILGDERQAFRQEQYYVTFFDEMAKADKVSIDALKNRITAELLHWRLLGSNLSRTARNSTTFLGATNEDLRDIIYDPTGMRRFHQMETLDRIDWDEINAIDYDEMWASVDHGAECPLKPVMAELRKHQDSIRAKDSVEEWYDENCSKGDKWTAAKELYSHYCDQIRKQARKPVSQTKFGRRLTEIVEEKIGSEGSGWKVSDGKKYAIKLCEAVSTEGAYGSPLGGMSVVDWIEKFGDPAA